MGRTISIDNISLFLQQGVPVYEIFNEDQRNDLCPIISNTEVQEKVVQCLQESEVFESNAYYCKLFLKSYISCIEKEGYELLEALYEVYCDPKILNAKELAPTDTITIHYPIGGFDSVPTTVVSIKETPKIISGINTTGLRTWEAALFLSNYLNNFQNPPYDFGNKTILELGGGTGLVSLALLKYYSNHIREIRDLVLTDGAVSVFDNFIENTKLNGINVHDDVEKGPKIWCKQLLWGTTNPEDKENFTQDPIDDVDVIVAADVTYDSTILEPLCSTIHDFFRQSNTKVAIIAATVRNEETIANWEKELDKWFGKDSEHGSWTVKHHCKEPEKVHGHVWFRRNTPEIRIYEIQSKL